MVTPLGTVSHTGVGGLTLGGGFGRLARKFGMAIDNLESVDIVTADGKLLHASASENPDLYWAARGGSGNFGIVTNFEFKLHPMQPQVVAGKVVYPIAKAREVLTMWSEYASTAPDDLYIDPTMALPPGNAPGMVSLEVCYAGPQADAERALAPIRKLGTPMQDGIKAMDYTHVQRINDSTDTRAIASYLKGGFIGKMLARARFRAGRRPARRSAPHDGLVLPALRRSEQPCRGRRDRVRAPLRAGQHDDRRRAGPSTLPPKIRRRTSRRRAATGRRSSRTRAASTSTTSRARSRRKSSTTTIAATTSGWSR